MSLLGNNVFANPTTPLWGGGGGVGTTIPYGTPLTFNGPSSNNPTLLEMDADAVLGVVDASANYGSFQTGDLRVYGAGPGGGSFVNIGTGFAGSNAPLGIRAVDINGTLQSTLTTLDTPATSWSLSNISSINSNSISFSSNQMDLSNVSSINGVPYFNSPGTQFDYSNYPGGSTLVEAPDWGVLNAISFTPPVDGKVYVESLGTYVALVTGGGVSMTFAVDGTNITEAPTAINAYDSNTNLFGTSMFQFSVDANVTYDISSIAHCSALPPASADVDVTSSRMFLLFSPN
jgi:hypothetical protein